MREQLKETVQNVISGWDPHQTPDCYDASKKIANRLLNICADVTSEDLQIVEYRLPIPGGCEFHYILELSAYNYTPSPVIIDPSFSQFKNNGRAHTTIPDDKVDTVPEFKICPKEEYPFTEYEVKKEMPTPFPFVCFDHQLQLTLSDNTLTSQYDCLTSRINLWPYKRSLTGISTTRPHLQEVITSDATPDGKYHKLHCKSSQFSRKTRITLLQSVRTKSVFGFFNTKSGMDREIHQLPIDQIRSIDTYNTEIAWETSQMSTYF